MRFTLPLVFAAFAASAAAESLSGLMACEAALLPQDSAFARGINPVLDDFVRLPSGSELYVRVEEPAWNQPRKWFFLVHGMLDNQHSYDDLAELLLNRGYGVVRMDLRGFGRSLNREIEHASAIGQRFSPDSFLDYRSQVRDLAELLDYIRDVYDIRRPHLVGHSMGGGLVMSLLANPEIKRLVAPRATVVAPYVYRLEYYQAEKFAYMGLPLPNPLFLFESLIPEPMRMAPQFLMDTLLNDGAMRITFASFFDEGTAKETGIPTAKLSEMRDHHISMAIAAVKGLRGLNSLSVIESIPREVQLDLVYGRKDSVLEEGLARKLALGIQRRGGRAYGLDTDHMITRNAPEELLQILEK
ncbi:MAG: alpha/beta fold hydrolase [Calothrix sp. SM1_5_4]|nr:alpha/beta fold hydrolase [Calothrix sp. SM1_5_4]